MLKNSVRGFFSAGFPETSWPRPSGAPSRPFPPGARRALLLAWMLALCGAAGCAGHARSFQKIERCLAEQDPRCGLDALEKRGTAGRDEVLFLLDRAMLLRAAGQLEESTRSFEAAKVAIEQRSALSVTEQTSSLVINDTTRSYVGEPFEQVMIHVFEALNYLETGAVDAARVEALQVDVRLRELADRYDEPILAEDPFSRYLAGLIYEDEGEWSDAMISYRLAYEAYQAHADRYPISVPRPLQVDLVRMAARVGLADEARRYRSEFGIERCPPLPADVGQGELVVFVSNGLAPVKTAESVTLPAPSGLLVRVALPRYEDRPNAVRDARVRVDGREADTVPVENIAGLAKATLEARLPGITTRALARAAAKYAAAREAQKQNQLAGFLLNMAAVLSEQADTRSWLTLPAEIRMARIPLAAGEYRVRLDVLGERGVVERLDLGEVTIRPGKKVFRSRTVYRP